MKYRASIIGGGLTLEGGDPGAIVTCCFHQRRRAPNGVPVTQ
jgi:hypothetical protein